MAIGDIMDYGRHCVGIREPDALARFVDVIQIADHEILGR